MAAPDVPTNYEKVLACVEFNLRQINNANGFYTDGMMVSGDGDWTLKAQDSNEIYLQKLAAVWIVPGDDEDDGKGIGNISRFQHTYMLLCMRELSAVEKDNGLKLRQIRARMIWDIKRMIRRDYHLQQAALALDFPISNPNDGQRLSCIHHHVIRVIGDADENYPAVRFNVVVGFTDIENINAVV